jgi:hypothetical protein
MKTIQLKSAGFILFVAATLLFSCKKQTDAVADTSMTEEEAAEVITASVSGNAQGFATQTAEINARANTYGATCGYSKDSAISKVNTTGTYTWNYNFNWHWDVVCTAAVPNKMNANYKMKGTYDTPRMSSNDSATAMLTVGNLVVGTQYIFNGTYSRDGSQVSKIRNKNSFTSKVVMNLNNLLVSKATGQIASGNASVTITGNTSTGNTFSYTGTITFNGASSATITLGNGNVYNISW